MELKEKTSKKLKIKIHLSQFSSADKEKYKAEVTKLGGTYLDNMLTYTNVLVCKTVLNQKYQIAQVLKCHVMSEEWLKHSIHSGKFISFDEMKLGIFQGVRVGVLGFSKQEYDQVVSV